jgi:hypothetical protein
MVGTVRTITLRWIGDEGVPLLDPGDLLKTRAGTVYETLNTRAVRGNPLKTKILVRRIDPSNIDDGSIRVWIEWDKRKV